MIELPLDQKFAMIKKVCNDLKVLCYLCGRIIFPKPGTLTLIGLKLKNTLHNPAEPGIVNKMPKYHV